jgi:hypothetical protein
MPTAKRKDKADLSPAEPHTSAGRTHSILIFEIRVYPVPGNPVIEPPELGSAVPRDGDQFV